MIDTFKLLYLTEELKFAKVSMNIDMVISNLSFITKNPILFSVVDKVLDRIEVLRK